jgi:predicted TIM-barrel fold metal-dependent hydrolase
MDCACNDISRRGVLASFAGLGATVFSESAPAQVAPSPPHRVDVHHHFFPPEYLEPLAEWGKQAGFGGLWPQQRNWTVAQAIEDMNRNAVSTAILSISTPGVWFGDAEAARRMARLCNDFADDMVRRYPRRFGLFASVPMPDVDGTLAEIEYALDVLKADGIGLMTSYGDKWPGDPLFAPVFDELDRRGALVYFHPLAPNCCAGMLIPGVTASPIEYPHDTTRAVLSLLTSGVLAQRRKIRFIFSHAGGTIPMLAGRIVNALKNRKDLSELAPDGIERELQKLHYDTANSFYAPTMAALLTLVPPAQVLFGSDFPYLTIGPNLAGLSRIGLTPSELFAIERGNAQRLIPRLRA